MLNMQVLYFRKSINVECICTKCVCLTASFVFQIIFQFSLKLIISCWIHSRVQACYTVMPLYLHVFNDFIQKDMIG